MKNIKVFALLAALLTLCACNPKPNVPQMEGHYSYEHAFNYDMQGHHFDVSESGTMDFYADSTALDSARQVYTVTLPDSSTTTWVFNYISPSRWHLEGDTLFFAGAKEGFRMELIEGDGATELAQKIIDTYSNGIEYEYRFHLDTLTADLLQWSFTYRDGHRDTWRFYRATSAE